MKPTKSNNTTIEKAFGIYWKVHEDSLPLIKNITPLQKSVWKNKIINNYIFICNTDIIDDDDNNQEEMHNNINNNYNLGKHLGFMEYDEKSIKWFKNSSYIYQGEVSKKIIRKNKLHKINKLNNIPT